MKIRIKYAIEAVLALLLKLFSVFPIKQNQVIFSAFSGRQYSDSPRRISEYLKCNHPEIKQVWAFTQPEKFNFLNEQGIITVKYKSLKYIYLVLTSKVYVDNVEHWSILRFRRQQMVLQTWHGGGAYKRIGSDRNDIGDTEKQHVIDKMNRITLFLSSSKAFTDCVIRGSYKYGGEVLPVGLPRNDELINKNTSGSGEVLKKLSIPDGSKIVMYAPTFRNSHDLSLYDVDFQRLCRSLEKRFSGNWVVLLRMHYYLAERLSGGENLPNVIDVSDYPDMQQLLGVTDVLVTDYSSTIWDFSFTGNPSFIYATDIDEYCGERDFYTPIEKWPFPLARNNDELEKVINGYNEEEYQAAVKSHLDFLGNCETGFATQKACEKIVEFIGGNE